MSKIKFTDQYFINLLAMVNKFGIIYATDDGNHYADEDSALTRCNDFLKIGILIRYAKITKENMPLCEEDMEPLWTMPAMAESTTDVPKSPRATDLDVDSAQREFELLRNKIVSDAPKRRGLWKAGA